jgi:hypothetical protein
MSTEPAAKVSQCAPVLRYTASGAKTAAQACADRNNTDSTTSEAVIGSLLRLKRERGFV